MKYIRNLRVKAYSLKYLIEHPPLYTFQNFIEHTLGSTIWNLSYIPYVYLMDYSLAHRTPYRIFSIYTPYRIPCIRYLLEYCIDTYRMPQRICLFLLYTLYKPYKLLSGIVYRTSYRNLIYDIPLVYFIYTLENPLWNTRQEPHRPGFI